MAKANNIDLVKEEAQRLLGYLGLDGEVSVQKKDEALVIGIDTPQASILIGRRGETISAFQNILGQIIYKLTGEGQRIIVDSGDWRTRQEESLRNLALNSAGKVVQTGEPQYLFGLRSDERRIVHLALADHPDVITESQGEGKERHIIIKPRTAQ